MSKTALITGVRGQDGAYLSKLLLSKGYKVVGTDRRRGDQNGWRFNYLGINDEVDVRYMDLLDTGNINHMIREIQPDEVYNLAAQSFVHVSFNQPELTCNVDAMGVVRLLEAIRTFKPDAKFYQASTSEMYGKIREKRQNEDTPFYPRSPYAVAKVFSHFMTVNYRESFNMFTCSGILFNHESPLRGLEFVTRKITYGIASIKLGLKQKITLGNLDAKRDWGYAKEYVEGMWKMMQHDTPGDYVLATGKNRTVRSFVEGACELAEIDIVWEGTGIEEKGIAAKSGKVIVDVSPAFYRPAEVEILLGDASKANKVLDWYPHTDSNALSKLMYSSDIEMLKKR